MKTIEIVPAITTGSEKQIAWATDIRAAQIARFDRLAAMPAENLGVSTAADKQRMIAVACIGLSWAEQDALRQEIDAFEMDLPSPKRSDPDRKAIMAQNMRSAYDFVLGKAAVAFERVTSAREWIDFATNK